MTHTSKFVHMYILTRTYARDKIKHVAYFRSISFLLQTYGIVLSSDLYKHILYLNNKTTF